jgi:hypothetical protein
MSDTAEYSESFSPFTLFLQAFLMAGVFYLWSSPVIQPIKIMVVLFHEMSHGVMALASGGEVLRIIITADEGGACETVGGIGELIVSAGYLGSMLFGGLILYLSKLRSCVPVVYTFLALLLAAAIFTVLRDPYSRTFATALAGCFIFLGLLAPNFLGVLGTVSCLYSIIDIYSDILADGAATALAENDAVAFSRLTGVPPSTVGMIWLCVSVLFFLFVLKALARPTQSPRAKEAA